MKVKILILIVVTLAVFCFGVAEVNADQCKAEILSPYIFKSSWKLKACDEYSCNYALTSINHGKTMPPNPNVITARIKGDCTQIDAIKADDDYIVVYKELLNPDGSEIKPTPATYGCDKDNKLTYKECLEQGYEWVKLTSEIPYDHPDGKDKTIGLADTIAINNYLGTSLNLSGKTKEEATEILIEEVKKFKAKVTEVEIIR